MDTGILRTPVLPTTKRSGSFVPYHALLRVNQISKVLHKGSSLSMLVARLPLVCRRLGSRQCQSKRRYEKILQITSTTLEVSDAGFLAIGV